MDNNAVHKEDILDSIGEAHRSAVRKYQEFFIGTTKLWHLFRYEVAHIFASPVPGILGDVLRKRLMIGLLGHAGDQVQIGCNVTFRHPGKISIGDRSVLEELCLLDARGIEDGMLTIGSDVIIGHESIIASKTPQGFLRIGPNTRIGMGCIVSSSGGIRIGSGVEISDSCFIGGSRYRMNRRDIPMYHQQMYTRGPVVIGDNCWIGPGARVLDGVTIGNGSIVGAGTTVGEDVPESTVVAPGQELENIPRQMGEVDSVDSRW